MARFLGHFSHQGDLTDAALFAGVTTPANGYVAEDGTTFYVAEDGSTYYVQEDISPPSQATAFGLTTLTFDDDFLSTSTIDLSNTGSPGFNWYLKQAWPNIPTSASPWGAWASATTTSPSVISLSGSNIVLSSEATGNDVVLSTACSASNAQGYNGQVFGGQSAYYEFSMATDITNANVQALARDPIGWGVSIDFLTGASNNFCEMDICEIFATGPGTVLPLFAIHDWATNSSTVTANNYNTNFSNTLGSPNLNTLNKYGCRIIVPADNAGTGLVDFYFNNTHLTANSITFSATGPSSGATPSNPNGIFNGLATQKMVLILSCGLNWPASYDYFRVWV